MYTQVQSLHLTNIITQKFCTLDENLWKFELLEIRTTVIDHQTAQAACAYRTSHGGCYDIVIVLAEIEKIQRYTYTYSRWFR